MKQLTFFVGLACLFAMTAIGCATITSGTTQSITVSSNVDGAQIYMEGEMVGTTPFTGTVKKSKKELRVEAAGYRSETISLSRSLEPIFWGNIIIGGTLGSITDFASGAAYQYAPATYQVVLKADGQTDASYIRELSVRKFAMIYIDQVSRDVANGQGQYLDALVTLSRSADGHEFSAPDVKSALVESRGNQDLFADLLMGLD